MQSKLSNSKTDNSNTRNFSSQNFILKNNLKSVDDLNYEKLLSSNSFNISENEINKILKDSKIEAKKLNNNRINNKLNYYNNDLVKIETKKDILVEFNNNLNIINDLKNENLGLFKQSYQPHYIMNIKKELNDSDFYSKIIKKLSFKNNPDINKQREIFLNIKKKKYRKSNEEIKCLEKYFSWNKKKWDSKFIKKWSEKLNIKFYSIYKWYWDKIKKIK